MDPYVSKDAEGVPFIQIGEQVLRLDLEDLDEHYKERARLELRETEKNVEMGLNLLKKWIEEEEGLELPVDDEKYLVKFLRPCKFYPESTFKLIKRYYKFIYKNPKYTADLIPTTVEAVFANNIIEFLPTRVKGSRVMVVNAGTNWNPKEISISLLFKAVIMCMEIAMIEPRTQVGGVHVILDLEGLSINHIWQLSPVLAKLIMDFVQNCTPVRLKGIHIVNQPYIFNMGYAIFKPFIGEKLRRRLFFHGKQWEQMQEHIPKNFLPEKYGGSMEMPHVPGKLMNEILKEYDDEYKKLSQFGYTSQKC